jgi:hypothetical protein
VKDVFSSVVRCSELHARKLQMSPCGGDSHDPKDKGAFVLTSYAPVRTKDNSIRRTKIGINFTDLLPLLVALGTAEHGGRPVGSYSGPTWPLPTTLNVSQRPGPSGDHSPHPPC